MTVFASSAGLDDLIGAIYDCVIDPASWHDTLDAIRQRYGFFNAMLSVLSGTSGMLVLSVAVNVPDDFQAIAAAQSEHIGALWGGWAQVNAVPLEEPVINSEVTTREQWPGNPYYEQFVAPQNIGDAMVLILARDALTVGNVAFGRLISAPALTSGQLDELRILAPHLRRAVAIGRLLETSMSAARSFAQVVDAASAGIVLVDGDRRIVHANATAQAMLTAGNPIASVAGQLQLPGEVVAGTLQTAIEHASEAVAGGKGAGVPARRSDGSPLTVHVLPLERRAGANMPSQAAAAVFVADSATGPATSAEVLSLLFDLTPAETRIFALIVDGLEIPEIGTRLSISPATAKTHLAHIYAKTGRNSRADLVRLAHELTPPL